TVPIILFLIYFVEIKKFLLASLFLFLGLLIKENIILVLLFLGIFWLIFKKRKQRAFGLMVLIISITYYLLVANFLMPAVGGNPNGLNRYGDLGNSPFEIAKETIIHPDLFFKAIFVKEKIIYLFKIFYPVGFLFLFFAPEILIPLIPGLAQNLLTNYSNQYSGNFQYEAILTPFIFYGLFLSFKKIKEKNFELLKIIQLIVLITLFSSFIFFSKISPLNYNLAFLKDTERVKQIHIFLKTVPNDISISTNAFLFPHLSNRQKTFLTGYEKKLSDWVILDNNNYFPFLNQESIKLYLNEYLLTENYEVKNYKNILTILIKKDLSMPPGDMKINFVPNTLNQKNVK
ncbi:DUF2079 domain-containing protein, partial [Patescibacteria group bacterium]|nr:DUF2079 domain-containing protein [Patescibacteria group bacterium]